jgi:hypothetical protein
MLRAACAGARLETLLADYASLRQVEACARWQAGRAVETLPLQGETAALVAALVGSDERARELGARVGAARARIASSFELVCARLGGALST